MSFCCKFMKVFIFITLKRKVVLVMHNTTKYLIHYHLQDAQNQLVEKDHLRIGDNDESYPLCMFDKTDITFKKFQEIVNLVRTLQCTNDIQFEISQQVYEIFMKYNRVNITSKRETHHLFIQLIELSPPIDMNKTVEKWLNSESK